MDRIRRLPSIYVSNTKNEDLVLDELRGDLEYLKNGITYKNRVLRLAKTFKQNSWNSFVLPVDLTVKQLRDAFGGTVRLAKLNALTATELQFKTVTLDGKADKDIALDAYQPYIIFPSKTMEDNNNSPYTATIAKNGSTENPYKVTIQAQRFEIPNVTFATNASNENDLSNMDEYWTTKLTFQSFASSQLSPYMRKKYTPPQSQTIPLDVSGRMLYTFSIQKPSGKGNPTIIRTRRRLDTFSPFTQEEEEENEDRNDATLWEL